MSDIKVWPDPHDVTIVYKRGFGPSDGDSAVEHVRPMTAEEAVDRLLTHLRDVRHYMPVHSKQYLIQEMQKIMDELQ